MKEKKGDFPKVKMSAWPAARITSLASGREIPKVWTGKNHREHLRNPLTWVMALGGDGIYSRTVSGRPGT